MAKKKPFNPFYAALVVIGVLFGMTALAYGMMAAIAQNNPALAQESMESGNGLVAIMDKHGFNWLMTELVVLAVMTVLAIGTDDDWTNRTEKRQQSAGSQE